MALPARPSRSVLTTGIPAGDRGFERQRHAFGFGEPGQFEAMGRNHRLVGGDERHATLESGLRRLIGRAVGAADQLDEDVDIPSRKRSRDRRKKPRLPDRDRDRAG